MTKNLQDIFNNALCEFVDNERILLSLDANELTISSRMAVYLGKHFTEWDVDCEYNRIGDTGQRKLIHMSKKTFKELKALGNIPNEITNLEELEKSGVGISVFPDIIVHHRGQEYNNLLVVEIKKAGNSDVELGWDEFKIHFFIKSLHYKAGVYIVFNSDFTNNNEINPIKSIQWFE